MSFDGVRFIAGFRGNASARAVQRRRNEVPAAALTAVVLCCASSDASAALRDGATAIGLLAMLGALLFLREWPMELASSVGAVGAGLAVFWYVWSRYRIGWVAFADKSFIRPVVEGSSTTAAPRRLGPAQSGSSDLSDEALLSAARGCFIDLQAAWDVGDLDKLREQTTAEMLADLLQGLPMRGSGPNRTEVLTLNAALLGFDRLGTRCVAGVEFSGMIRERAGQDAVPFKEVWMLTCEEHELPDWRLARQQALF